VVRILFYRKVFFATDTQILFGRGKKPQSQGKRADAQGKKPQDQGKRADAQGKKPHA